jgi:hypothetical protein
MLYTEALIGVLGLAVFIGATVATASATTIDAERRT